MSSSELSNDETYWIEFYREDGPPLISDIRNTRSSSKSKRTRLLAAACRNDVKTLKQLLDSPKWYDVRDKFHLNLLHIAILRENDEVFDYLLSLDDFPLEAEDDEGATALVVALSYRNSSDDEMSERYACELIKKGADIDETDRYGHPLLHCALRRSFVRVARLLLERGADVNMLNHEGETPLHMCGLCYIEDLAEAVSMLLCYGADPSIRNIYGRTILDTVCYKSRYLMLADLENVFYFTIDEWSSYKILGGALMELAQNRSPLFHQVVKYTSEVICEGGRLNSDSLHLFTIDSEYLGILLEKYPYFVEDLVQSHSGDPDWHWTLYFNRFNLKNFDMLMQSSLDSDTKELICRFLTREIIPDILRSGKNVDEIMGIIYHLLSYGMSLNEEDLEWIYKKTGYSEDFKNLLFMDIEKKIGVQITEMMPRLICDVTFDIHKIVEDPSLCKFIDWEQIFNYFVHPKIQNAYYQIKSNEGIEIQLPQVPLLQELSRDVFRKYFIKTFKITTAKQFYSLIKRLPISSVHEKILTFETKLYYN